MSGIAGINPRISTEFNNLEYIRFYQKSIFKYSDYNYRIVIESLV